MTNSETQTKQRSDSPEKPRKQRRAALDGDVKRHDNIKVVRPLDLRTSGLTTGRTTTKIRWALGLAFVLIGWLGILHANRWYFGPPVVFLWLGWLAVLIAIRFLWSTGMSAASDDMTAMDEQTFWKPVGPQDELLREKRALLKAIKEIDFDYQMGKMSDQDAKELTRLYRARAIEIIKTLEAGEKQLSISEQIEQEVKARLSVANVSAKVKAQGPDPEKQAPEKQAPEKQAPEKQAKAGHGDSETNNSTSSDASGDTSGAANAEVGS